MGDTEPLPSKRDLLTGLRFDPSSDDSDRGKHLQYLQPYILPYRELIEKTYPVSKDAPLQQYIQTKFAEEFNLAFKVHRSIKFVFHLLEQGGAAFSGAINYLVITPPAQGYLVRVDDALRPVLENLDEKLLEFARDNIKDINFNDQRIYEQVLEDLRKTQVEEFTDVFQKMIESERQLDENVAYTVKKQNLTFCSDSFREFIERNKSYVTSTYHKIKTYMRNLRRFPSDRKKLDKVMCLETRNEYIQHCFQQMELGTFHGKQFELNLSWFVTTDQTDFLDHGQSSSACSQNEPYKYGVARRSGDSQKKQGDGRKTIYHVGA